MKNSIENSKSKDSNHPKDDNQFKENLVYEMQYIGDSELRPKWKCIKITPKTATFERVGFKEVMR